METRKETDHFLLEFLWSLAMKAVVNNFTTSSSSVQREGSGERERLRRRCRASEISPSDSLSFWRAPVRLAAFETAIFPSKQSMDTIPHREVLVVDDWGKKTGVQAGDELNCFPVPLI